MSRLRIFVLFPLLLQFQPAESGTLPAEADRPKVAVVLSGGGARGGAHIGVLRHLEEAGVPIDLITGTSVGALIGGLYATGYTTEDIELIVRTIDWDELLDDRPDRSLLSVEHKDRLDRGLFDVEFQDWNPKARVGLKSGRKIEQLLDRLTAVDGLRAGGDYDLLPIPFRAVATDLITGQPHVFAEGPISRSLRASMAIPGVFTPVEFGSTMLVDGGIVDNVPVGVAREWGADIVIAVDISTPARRTKDQIQSLFDVLDQAISINIEANTKRSHELADYVIRPELGEFFAGDFAAIADLVEVGYQAVEKDIPEVQRLLAAHSIPKADVKKESRLGPGPLDLENLSVIGDEVEIDRIVLSGLESYPEFAKNYLYSAPVRVSTLVIDEEIEALYGTDHFKEIGYRLDKVKDETVLTIDLQESPETRLGFGIRYDIDYNFTGVVDFFSRNLPFPRSELLFRGMVGNASEADLGLRIRPSKKDFAFLPRVYYRSHQRRVFDDGEAVGSVDDDRSGFSVGASYLIGNSARVYGGYVLERTGGFEQFGIGYLEESKQGGFRFVGAVDTRDRAYYAARGFKVDLSIDLRDPGFGGEVEYQKVNASGEFYFNTTPRTNLSLHGGWGIVSGNSVPYLDQFFSGGAHYLRFSSMPFVGLQRDQIAARHFLDGGLTFRYRLKTIPLGIIRNVYLGAKYQTGLFNQGDDLDEFRELIHGFGGGVYLDSSFLGPIALEFGGTNEKDFNVYFSFGYRF